MIKLDPELFKNIGQVLKGIKRAFRKAHHVARIRLLNSPEGRRHLIKYETNNNWRKMHGLPMTRRSK